jgi:acetyl esterase/lipase
MRIAPKTLATYVLAAALALAPAAACAEEAAPKPPITFRQLLERPREQPDARIAYGHEELQYGDLWLPEGRGPHPVVVLIHGGCWRADLPGLELMDYMAADLRRRGVAVWNLEYRRVGGEGGYPATFQDVADGVDQLRRMAGPSALDLDRVVISGHSAGGHLALWAAARERLPRSSPLWRAKPLKPRGVVTLSGINDLEAYRQSGPEACGGPATIDGLVGAPGARPDVYADTSPSRLLPLRVRQVIVSGPLDRIVPTRFGEDYARLAAAKGDRVQAVEISGAGHFELIDPRSHAWVRVRAFYDALLAPDRGR